MKPSTVLIVCYAFKPSNEIGARRTTALARYLADNGIRVVVVSAFANQPVEPGSELYPGVIAVPVKLPTRAWLDLLVTLKRRLLAQRKTGRDDSSFSDLDESSALPSPTAAPPLARLRERYLRLVNVVDECKKWAWMAARAAVRAGRQYDATLLLASGPPHSGLLAGAWAARRLGVPYVADLRDPFSDDPWRLHELKLLRVLERWIMRSAAVVTLTNAAYALLLAERNKDLAGKIHVIRNGYDGAVAPPLTATGGRLSILFAGVLYRCRTPFPLLAALEELLSQPDVDSTRIRLTFMGSKLGPYSDQALETWIRGKRCAAVVRILPQQDSAAVAQEVAKATVLLNLAQQGPLYVPAKTYEQLASGREVLLICEDDTEPAQIVAGIRGVIRVDQSNAQALVEVLRDLYNRHVVAGTASVPTEAEVRRFSRALSNERFWAVLTSVARLRPSPERTPGVQPELSTSRPLKNGPR
jgi:glycosyltransferase involved in cell wall biosynthesis